MSRLGTILATCLLVFCSLGAAAHAADWSVVASPNASVGSDSIVRGVSCSSSTSCTAVGEFPPPGGGARVAGALRWDGTAWVSQPIPDPPSTLDAVSCPSVNHCVAVGNTGAPAAVAASWDGTSWTVETVPNPAGALNSSLGGVSCSSDTRCTAVGSYRDIGGVQRTLAEGWDGVSWTIQSTPNPAGSQYSQLSAVSCSSENACRAVGYFETSGGVTTALAERWNGSSWARQTVPVPADAKFSELTGVACVSTGECMAVGLFGPSTGVEVALSERWDGTAWALVAVPAPSGAPDTWLNARVLHVGERMHRGRHLSRCRVPAAGRALGRVAVDATDDGEPRHSGDRARVGVLRVGELLHRGGLVRK